MHPKGPRTKNPSDQLFLKRLGQACQKARQKLGLSIDRLAKESESLSVSVIHRLETGSGPVTLLTLKRYAAVIGVLPSQLLAEAETVRSGGGVKFVDSAEFSNLKEAADEGYLPVFSVRAAAGYFGGADSSTEPHVESWVKAPKSLRSVGDHFVIQVVGKSMQPQISDGNFAVFRANPAGSRQGKIVLVQYRGPADPDTGGAYTVKRYSSSKWVEAGRKDFQDNEQWRHQQITLSPLNPDYEPIVLFPQSEGDFRVIGEWVENLGV